MKSNQILQSAGRLAAILAVIALSASAFAQGERVIYNFNPQVVLPLGPANLISDASGNLYGADLSLGVSTVFELSPPAHAGASWTLTPIYAVGESVLSLAMDKNGNIFGTTLAGGFNGTFCSAGCGTVFELSPPAQPGGAWTETILYEFLHGERGPTLPHPTGITVGPGGILYGAAQSGGNSEGDGLVFQLRPPKQSGGAWAYQILYQFQGSSDGAYPTGFFAFDKNLNLYGTTRAGGVFNSTCSGDCGTVFELSPPAAPGGAWTKTTVLNLQGFPTDGNLPNAGLIMDKAGNLYGSTFYGGNAAGSDCSCGTVFELTPPAELGSAWTETILHNFANSPDGSLPLGVTVDPAGNLYGATVYGGSFDGGNGEGTVFEVKPPVPGGAWTETILHNFPPEDTGSKDGVSPESNVVYKSGVVYGATEFGGPAGQCNVGCGVIFAVRP